MAVRVDQYIGVHKNKNDEVSYRVSLSPAQLTNLTKLGEGVQLWINTDRKVLTDKNGKSFIMSSFKTWQKQSA